jgi:hypothetical protein
MNAETSATVDEPNELIQRLQFPSRRARVPCSLNPQIAAVLGISGLSSILDMAPSHAVAMHGARLRLSAPCSGDRSEVSSRQPADRKEIAQFAKSLFRRFLGKIVPARECLAGDDVRCIMRPDLHRSVIAADATG